MNDITRGEATGNFINVENFIKANYDGHTLDVYRSAIVKDDHKWYRPVLDVLASCHTVVSRSDRLDYFMVGQRGYETVYKVHSECPGADSDHVCALDKAAGTNEGEATMITFKVGQHAQAELTSRNTYDHQNDMPVTEWTVTFTDDYGNRAVVETDALRAESAESTLKWAIRRLEDDPMYRVHQAAFEEYSPKPGPIEMALDNAMSTQMGGDNEGWPYTEVLSATIAGKEFSWPFVITAEPNDRWGFEGRDEKIVFAVADVERLTIEEEGELVTHTAGVGIAT